MTTPASSLYLPRHFDRSADREAAARFIRAHAFAQLLTVGEGGEPFVTHLPLHLEDRPEGFCLLGHVAKPNAQWRHLQGNPKALVVFRGPHAYMSPSVYPDLQRVPTWNYVVLHAQVQAALIDGEDEANKDRILKCLIGDHEPVYVEQWRALPHAYTSKMLTGIVAFELNVTQIELKVKVNQHRAEAREAMLAQYDSGTADEKALAQWLRSVVPTA
jgi:transcriptional regulator